nr:putative ribonuclease H-like domain-containing protein [Tanacetum cinerariifolium]
MRPFGYPVTILNTLDSLGKFDGKVDEGFLVGYSVSSKAFRVFNSRTRIVQKTLHVNFLENKPNVAGSGPTWLFDIDTFTKTTNYQPVTADNQSNPSAGVQENFDAEKNTDGDAAFDEKEPEFDEKKPEYEVNVSLSSSAQSKKHDDKIKREAKGKSHVESFIGYRNLSAEFKDFSDNSINEDNAAGTLVPAVEQISPNSTNTFSTAELEDITYSDDEDDVGAEADFNNLETSITVSHIPTTKVHKDYPMTQIIGDLSLATQTRSMTRVAKDQEPKRLHQAFKDPSWIEAMQEELLQFKMQKVWFLVDLPHGKRAIVAYSNSDYAGASLDRKSTTGGCQFLGCRLIYWQCKKQTVGATSSTEAEYVADVSCCAQVLWIQNQLLDYGYNFMHTIIYIDNSSTIVNTPRCDEDRLELIELMVFLLPGDEKVRVEVSVVDLQVSAVRLILLLLVQEFLLFGLTNWCCSLNDVNDVTRLQALVDKKKVVITEALIRDVLRLDDAEGVECLSNKEIFAELARMGYEKPSTKLTFYKAFFSSQWNLVRNVDSPTKFYMYPYFLQLMIKKQVGDLSTHTIKYTFPALTQKVAKGDDDEVHVEDVNAVGVATEGVVSAADGVPTIDDEPSIPSPTPPTPPPQPFQDVPLTSQVNLTPPQSPQVQPQSPQPQPQPSQDA